MPHSEETSQLRLVSTLTKSARPLYSSAYRLYAGAIMRHGPQPRDQLVAVPVHRLQQSGWQPHAGPRHEPQLVPVEEAQECASMAVEAEAGAVSAKREHAHGQRRGQLARYAAHSLGHAESGIEDDGSVRGREVVHASHKVSERSRVLGVTLGQHVVSRVRKPHL